MSATNFSMIWAQLASPYQSSGMIPFVDTDNASITGDVLNFYYDQKLTRLFVKQGFSMPAITQTGVVNPSTPYSLGRITLRAGQTSVIVTAGAIVVNTDFVFISPLSVDATATRFGVSVATGSFTITANAAATAAVDFYFLIVHAFPVSS